MSITSKFNFFFVLNYFVKSLIVLLVQKKIISLSTNLLFSLTILQKRVYIKTASILCQLF